MSLTDVLKEVERVEREFRLTTEALGLTHSALKEAKVLLANAEAALAVKDNEIAALRGLIRWAHDTLIEIDPSDYDHDDVCSLNDASVEVILGLAPTLGETHGYTKEWWASRNAGGKDAE